MADERSSTDAASNPNPQLLSTQSLFERNYPIPSLWLFGKAQSGKTSIVRYLTGAEHAVIGNGFQPETERTYRYTFPTEAMPVLRFFDTRGLGEADYDPTVDTESLQQKANGIIVTVRVNDFAVQPVLEPLRRIRAARPLRPIVLALTWLHSLYPRAQHPSPDPFLKEGDHRLVPEALSRCIQEQQKMFGNLVDRTIPIDLTKPEDGFNVPDFGGQRLKDALIELLPAALGEAIRNTDDTLARLREDLEQLTSRKIRRYSRISAGVGAIPLPLIDIPAVTGIQLQMVRRIAEIYDQPPLPAALVTSLPMLGGRFLLRQGAKILLKGLPFLSMPANAATAYLTTTAIGRAANWYYWQRMLGRLPASEEFRQMVEHQIQDARNHWDRPTPQGQGEAS